MSVIGNSAMSEMSEGGGGGRGRNPESPAQK